MAKNVPFSNVAEAEKLAQKFLPKAVWVAFKAGNEQGWTLDENVRAYNDLGFTPTVFNRPTRGEIDTKTRILGVDIDVDGGIRRGSDVVKALALGAKAVFIGRAYLYGLAVSGEDGVHKVLEIRRDGIEETMFGIGRDSIKDLSMDDLIIPNRDFLVKPTR